MILVVRRRKSSSGLEAVVECEAAVLRAFDAEAFATLGLGAASLLEFLGATAHRVPAAAECLHSGATSKCFLVLSWIRLCAGGI